MKPEESRNREKERKEEREKEKEREEERDSGVLCLMPVSFSYCQFHFQN
jgi:ribosomal protein L12E/L44/L45/RPP1/RPP2